jgi:hypothetical protein
MYLDTHTHTHTHTKQKTHTHTHTHTKQKQKTTTPIWEGDTKGKNTGPAPQTTVILPLDLEGCFHGSYFRLLCSLTNLKSNILVALILPLQRERGGSHTKLICLWKASLLWHRKCVGSKIVDFRKFFFPKRYDFALTRKLKRVTCTCTYLLHIETREHVALFPTCTYFAIYHPPAL